MERLSEQLALQGRLICQTATGTVSGTGAGFDMRDVHQVYALAHGEASTTSKSTTTSAKCTTTASTNLTLAITIQASTAIGFGGTPVAVASTSQKYSSTVTATASAATGKTTATATATINTNLELAVWGSEVQGARAAEDRYVRAIITITGVKGGAGNESFGIVFADTGRYKPV
ncbi:MAG: hypothetical protein GWN61_00720 [candidate division Zixibacteria bacterium]|nr:hypothetical protein [candidate division Zixibacteria bacterium]NIT70444.1 hypothetical protein [candidate division KSB1 bacterium]NIW97402.1 hypothetical protein [Phycisphaerae bacterium]NIU12622.1 hypothetical protein [candidate division Zixibacteria bacterium]NIV04751.1 hypothetical protein [candidate division Zixibacteria bacterium]